MLVWKEWTSQRGLLKDYRAYEGWFLFGFIPLIVWYRGIRSEPLR